MCSVSAEINIQGQIDSLQRLIAEEYMKLGVVMVKEGDIRHTDNVRGMPGGSFDIIKFVKIKGLLKFR